MSLPILALDPSKCSNTNLAVIRDAWLKATGRDLRPATKSWKNFRGDDKYRLVHGIAKASQEDAGDYLSPYLHVDIHVLLDEKRYSVEHVVPRSKCSDAEGDAWNFVEAERSENSRRSNLPLKLWPDLEDDVSTQAFETYDGQVHYVPPLEERARLARKWLYTRATYHCTPMSKAQRAHLSEIIALCKAWPPSATERAVARLLQAKTGTQNPLLLDKDPNQWYDCTAWRALVAAAA
jgi:endonuclease I